MKDRVLITGGSGLLAINWAQTLKDRFFITLGLHSREVSIPEIQIRRVELESVDGLVCLFRNLDINVVIHAAGMTSVERCELEPSAAYYANVKLAANVAEACALAGVKFVHISTDHLFSGVDQLVNEGQPVCPINAYGNTKAKGESYVLEINPESLVIRTNFYGWGTSYRRSFSDVIIEALRAGNKFVLFEDAFYTPILIETLALAVHDLLDLNAHGIYHVVGDDRLSKYEFGLKIAEFFGFDSGLIVKGLLTEHQSIVRRPLDMSLSNSKTCELLGRPMGGVHKHLARLQQQQKNGYEQKMRKI